MSNRIYAYTVVGKDAEPWERISGRARIDGHGSDQGRADDQAKRAGPDQAAARHRVPESRRGRDPARRAGGPRGRQRVQRSRGPRRARRGGNQASRRASGSRRPSTRSRPRSTRSRSGVPFEPDAHRVVSDAPRAGARPSSSPPRTSATTPATTHPPKFLWNAKMRFGKTFATYQLAREMGWTRVLVLTYKPAVQAAWRDDLLGHVDFAGWHFVDRETPIGEADELLKRTRPGRPVRVVPGPDRKVPGRRSQGAQRVDPPDSTGTASSSTSTTSAPGATSLASSTTRPTQTLAEEEEPDEEVTEEDLGLEARALPLPLRHPVPGDHERRVHRGRHLRLDLRRRAGGEGGAGTTSDGPNPYLELPEMEMYAYEIGPGAVGLGRGWRVQRASR